MSFHRKALLNYVLKSSLVSLLLVFFFACGSAETEVVEVIKEVPVEKEIIKEVEVEKIVVEEKEVVKEVIIEKEGETKTVEVVTVKEREKIIEVIPTPIPGGGVAISVDMSDFVFKSNEPNPVRGGILRMTFGVSVKHTDHHQMPVAQGAGPHNFTVMYNGLIRMNPNTGMTTIMPDLADKWEISADGKIYKFHLREGVRWHDGTDLSVDDVIATFERIVNPPDNIAIGIQSLFTEIDTIEDGGDNWVVFNLKRPSAHQFNAFTMLNATILPKKCLEDNNFDVREVVCPGTGPFKFVEYIPGEYMLFEKNEDYWNPELPYIDGIRMIHAGGTARGVNVITDVADFAWNTSEDGYAQAQADDRVLSKRMPNTGSNYFGWNNAVAPFNDKRVRRAIHLVINPHNFNRVSLGATNPSRWIPTLAEGATPESEFFNLAGYRDDNAADIEEAKQLMSDAGYPNCEGFPVKTMVGYKPDGALPVAFMDMINSNLGCDIQPRAVERALVQDQYAGEAFKAGTEIVQHLVPVQAIKNYTPFMLGLYGTGSSQNFTNYSNPEVDALLDTMLGELDPDARAAYTRLVQSKLDEDPPLVLVGFDSHRAVWGPHVHFPMDIRTQSIWGRVDTIWMDKR